MEWSWIWKGILIVLVGTLLLRIAGRKTISQMTLAETIIMISIGTALVQPIADKNIWIAIGTGAVLVLTLIVMEFGQLKFDGLEKLITGKSKVLIENGSLNEKTMAKLRMTVDQLEMNLRQKNVTSINDVQWATLEPNGQLGYTLKEDAQPVTKKEFKQLQQATTKSNEQQIEQLNNQLHQIKQQLNQNNIFAEVKNKEHKNTPPEHLQ
ncbi:DUF421 domain-containing protein [Virgibacillus siamensis]|uniref:DUF421 domain-containing protein n=1 Tax=Virgibacillus siamensis TaxID=480071 RepID=UPI000986A10D|nr:DUF421 domain-containing protein [Virgibacillus siamensis]